MSVGGDGGGAKGGFIDNVDGEKVDSVDGEQRASATQGRGGGKMKGE